MQTSIAQENWVGGEASPNMRGRFDLPLYASSSERLVNWIPEAPGAARFRTGTQFVNPTRRNQVACVIPFQFNSSGSQAYLLELTQGYIRFYQNNGILTLSSVAITGVTAANPGVVTSAAHGLSNGDEVIISGVKGMSRLNGRNFVVQNVTANTFQLFDTFGTNAVDTTSFGAYVSGGTFSKIYEVVSPYSTADLFALKYAQNADTMYLVHRSYAPQKLVRSGATTWSLGTFIRAGDPFTGANKYPGAIAFYQGRLIYAGTNDEPQSLWGSKPIDTSGNPQYDDMTVGTNPTDAFKFTMSSSSGKVDKIHSLVPTLNFLAICTFEGISKCDGGAAGDPISPSTISITPAVTQGCLQQVTPILLGINLVYVHRSGLILNSMEFDIFYSAFNVIDKTLSNEHITQSGVTQMVYRTGRPTMFLYPRQDGALIGTTFMVKENINGACRILFGGKSSKCLSVGNMPRDSAYDQTWVVVERVINGQTVRYVEYLTDDIIFPERCDYYTGQDNEASDDATWRNAIAEVQKQYVYTDASLTYDGSDYATVTMTPGAVTGTSVTFTAGGSVFDSTMVGREIRKKSVNGVGTGRAVITAYTSPTVVTCNIISDFDSVSAMPLSGWYLTTNQVNGAWHLEGETVGVLTDGGQHADQTVSAGLISLQYQASVVSIGENYLGMIKSLSVEGGAQPGSGPSQGKTKICNRIDIHFLNSLGLKYGSSLYTLQEVEFRSNVDSTGRPSPVFTGIKNLPFEDVSESEKHIYLVQDRPLPCTVLMALIFTDVSDD